MGSDRKKNPGRSRGNLSNVLYPDDADSDGMELDAGPGDDTENDGSGPSQVRSMSADEMAKALYPVAGKQGGDDTNDAPSSGDDDQAGGNGGQAYPGLINSTLTESYPDGTVKRGGSRAWRNNNPGNEEYKSQEGAIGRERAGRFAKFATEADGMNALKDTLRTVYKGKLPAQLTKRYAPEGDGNNDLRPQPVNATHYTLHKQEECCR